MRSSRPTNCRAVRRRLGRERLRRRRLLAGDVGLRHRTLLDRPHRLAGNAVEDVEERLLARHRHGLDRLAVDVDVEPGSAPTRGRSPRSDGARPGSATSAGRSSGRCRRGFRRTGCCPGDGRRRSPTMASRPAGTRARASSSTVICVQTPTLPFVAHDSFSHVSLPNSPGFGIVLNCHSILPVLTSNARTWPLLLLCVLTVMPSLNAEPTMTTSFTTVGVECRPISPVSRSICWPLPKTVPFFMSTTPPSPKTGSSRRSSR